MWFRKSSALMVVFVSIILGMMIDWAVAQSPNAVTLGSSPDSTLTESVTVVGVKDLPETVINSFVQSYTAPTRMIGKIARWESEICPVTVGLAPSFTRFVTQRVKMVAQMVGAPVDQQQSCKDNLDIVFTAGPQALLDDIRKNHPLYLGYHDNSTEADRMAKVTHPIQAWYTTETADLRGNPQIDSAQSGGTEVTMPSPPAAFAGQMSGPSQGFYTLYLPHASARSTAASRLGDGLSSAYYHIIIVIDPNKLREYEIGTVAHYIAMLALSQPQSLDLCQGLPSITNLLAPGCEGSNVTNSLTGADIAFLSGLYKITLNGTVRQQRDEIAFRMKDALASR